VKLPPDLKVGYIMAQATRSRTLAEIGVHPHLLTPSDLAQGELSSYDAIIVGIRAYSPSPTSLQPRRACSLTSKRRTLLVIQSVEFPAPIRLLSGAQPGESRR